MPKNGCQSVLHCAHWGCLWCFTPLERKSTRCYSLCSPKYNRLNSSYLIFRKCVEKEAALWLASAQCRASKRKTLPHIVRGPEVHCSCLPTASFRPKTGAWQHWISTVRPDLGLRPGIPRCHSPDHRCHHGSPLHQQRPPNEVKLYTVTTASYFPSFRQPQNLFSYRLFLSPCKCAPCRLPCFGPMGCTQAGSQCCERHSLDVQRAHRP